MGSLDVLRLVDRVLRIGLALQALLVIALTALWSANVHGWISVKQLSAVFGASVGWDLRFGLIYSFFALIGCLLFALGVLIMRSLLLLVGVPSWELRWWVWLLALQSLAAALFAFAVAPARVSNSGAALAIPGVG